MRQDGLLSALESGTGLADLLGQQGYDRAQPAGDARSELDDRQDGVGTA